jgi:hypothetical protein
MKEAQFDRAAYVNQQPLNEQLRERSTIPTYLSDHMANSRCWVRENESAGRREIRKSRA